MKDGKVSLLFNVAYILSGYTLVAASERNKVADVYVTTYLLPGRRVSSDGRLTLQRPD